MQQKTIDFSGDNTCDLVEKAIAKAGDGHRSNLFREIEATLGLVPEFMKLMPGTHLQGEWHIFKDFQLSDQTSLTPKVKELIGLAVASAIHCKYCSYFHTVGAGLNGATPDELNEALLMAKQTTGWSSYLHGARYDLDALKREVNTMKRHVEANQTQTRVAKRA